MHFSVRIRAGCHLKIYKIKSGMICLHFVSLFFSLLLDPTYFYLHHCWINWILFIFEGGKKFETEFGSVTVIKFWCMACSVLPADSDIFFLSGSRPTEPSTARCVYVCECVCIVWKRHSYQAFKVITTQRCHCTARVQM